MTQHRLERGPFDEDTVLDFLKQEVYGSKDNVNLVYSVQIEIQFFSILIFRESLIYFHNLSDSEDLIFI